MDQEHLLLATRWYNDIMAAFLKVWCRIKNPSLSVNAYVIEEQSGKILSRSHLKCWNFRLFWRAMPQEEEEQ